MTRHLVAIINEFYDPSSPVSKMAIELQHYLQETQKTETKVFYVAKNYTPGGLKPRRILNLLFFQILLPILIVYLRIKAFISGKKPVLIVVTNPPLVHWMVLLFGRLLLGIPTIVWYQDAHPEFEVRYLKKLKLGLIASALDIIDISLLRKANSIVTLDNAMAARLRARTQRPLLDIRVAPPWATYLRPGRPLRVSEDLGKLKLLYAGNYGFAHDLAPLVDVLLNIESNSLKRISITFVGMNEKSQDNLKKLFSTIADVETVFMPRFSNISALCEKMQEFDFGIVSLNGLYGGISCPSKSLSYISQGLPILYVGPKGTLSHVLASEGWGAESDKTFIETYLAGKISEKLKSNEGKIFADPSLIAMQEFSQLVASQN